MSFINIINENKTVLNPDLYESHYLYFSFFPDKIQTFYQHK